MDKQIQADQLEPTYNCSVLIQDVALKTYKKRWTIENGGGRGSRISVLMAWYDDNDIMDWEKITLMYLIVCPAMGKILSLLFSY